MEFIEAKKELKSYLAMEHSKKELQEWIDSQKYDTKITSTLSSEPKGSPKHQDQMAEKLTKALDKEVKIQEQINDMNEKQNKILDKIMMLDKPYQTILFCIYIQGKTIERAGMSINYAHSQTYRIMNKAIDRYAEL